MVSICILNWNCIDILKKTISLLKEDLVNIEYEILIFDQNSTDDSKNFLSSLNTHNIKIILSDKNVGNSISRNQMIKVSKFNYILLLDSDIIPIRNSIKCMLDFMEQNLEYVFLGYDYNSYSLDIEKITESESEIKKEDVIVWRDKLALSQYGLFRKSIFNELTFPEFYPFDREGWGAEDDVLGYLIFKSNIGLGGTIMNRVYYHMKSSSIPLLGQDNFQMMYIRRVLHFLYFTNVLSFENQLFAIKGKSLPTTKLRCNKYSWRLHNNLGDVASDCILSDFFPFLEFDVNNKTNLLIFGGTVLNHIENANRINLADFKNILFFGVGVSCEDELLQAKEMITRNEIKYVLVSRGPKSESEFLKHGFECQVSCGDVLQLFSGYPLIEHKEDDQQLVIYDHYIKEQIFFETSKNIITVKVANDWTKTDIPFYGLNQFLKLLNNVSKVYSSQIHPPFIASLLGKPSQFYSKDWRIEDFKYFSSFSENMTAEQSLSFRLEAQKNVTIFGELFFYNIRMFL